MALTIKDALSFGKAELSQIEYPNIEANILLCHALGVDRIYLMINEDRIIPIERDEEFRKMVALRKAYMPVAYILGYREFYGRDFICREGVLIPRTDTETLIEESLKLIETRDLQGLEIGVGTGIISVTLLCENQNLLMTAVDVSNCALKLATENAGKHQVKKRLKIVESDLFESLGENTYDFIVSNPPYIETKEIENLMPDVRNYEPHLALNGKEDGLYFYKKIADQGRNKIKSGGFLALEIGYNQGHSVPNILKKKGYVNIKVIKDLQGNDRVVTGVNP